MKKLISLLLLVLTVGIVQSQNYEKQTCSHCNGTGSFFTGYYDYMGQPIWYPCQYCGGYGFVLVPSSNNSPSFRGRLVSFYSKTGGTQYGTGTFYSTKMQVVTSGGVYLNVSRSDSENWNYMIVFSKGPNWYFD